MALESRADIVFFTVIDTGTMSNYHRRVRNRFSAVDRNQQKVTVVINRFEIYERTIGL